MKKLFSHQMNMKHHWPVLLLNYSKTRGQCMSTGFSLIPQHDDINKSSFKPVSRIKERSQLSGVGLNSILSLSYNKSSNSPQTDDQLVQVVSNAEKIVGYPTSFMSLRFLLSDEMSTVAMYIRMLVGTKHPLLKIARGLFFNGRYGMQTRGLIVLLMSKAACSLDNDNRPSGEIVSGITNKQRGLAEVIETIHLANLVHKGIVNVQDSALISGSKADLEFGNKIAVLTGDFLLANACTNLAKLENPEVVEMVSDSISSMMESNFVYPEGGPVNTDHWAQFTFLSRGALLASCCASALKLAGCDANDQQAAFNYGKHVAYANQIREDLRPFLEDAKGHEEISMTSFPVINYIMKHGSEITNSRELQNAVRHSESIQISQDVCCEHGEKALQALRDFNPSPSRLALQDIAKALTSFPINSESI